MEGLQAYTQALPELQNHLRTSKCEEDLASDGVFLTHFLMLIYEVCKTYGMAEMLLTGSRLRRRTWNIPKLGRTTCVCC